MLTVTYEKYDFKPWSENDQTWFQYQPDGERRSRSDAAMQKAVYDLSLIHSESVGVWPLGRRYLSQTGTLPPVIPGVDFAAIGGRSKSVNKDFKKRCNDGEIVMSPYEVYKCSVDYQPRNREEKSIRKVGEFAVDPSMLGPSMTVENAWYWNRWHDTKLNEGTVHAFAWDGYPSRLMFDSIMTPLSVVASTVGHPRDPNVNATNLAYRTRNAVVSHETLNHIVIQEVTGKANAGDIDVLTALAELPKTIESIWDGFRLIAKIFKDAKKKEMRLFASIPSRERRLATEAHKKKVAKKLARIPSFSEYQRWNKKRRISQKEYDDFVFHRKAVIEDLETFISRSRGKYRARAAREVAEAVAGVHLNVQYNIKPAVYTIEDTVKAITNFDKEFRRYGTGLTPEVIQLQGLLPAPVPGAVFTGTATMKKRCLIKRSYGVGDAFENLKRVASVDILVTGYELIKLWSIIFDWFFTIGPALRAIPWNQVYKEQKACYSYKTEIDGKWTWQVDGVTHHAQVEYEGFRREIINPHSSIGIYWNPDVDGTRAFSALAFFFNSVNGSLKRRYS